MTAAEWCQISGKSPDPREQSRYDASARLSVAPMMDWTDLAEKDNRNNRLPASLRVMLRLRRLCRSEIV